MTQPPSHPPTANYQPNTGAPSNGMAIAALVLGIVALLFAFTFCLSFLGILLGIVGVILGIVGLNQAKKSGGKTGMAMTGLILSAAAILIAIVVYIVSYVFLERTAGGLENFGNRTQLIGEATNTAQSDADAAIQDGADPDTVSSLQQEFTNKVGSMMLSGDTPEETEEKIDDALEEYRDKLAEAVEAGSAAENP